MPAVVHALHEAGDATSKHCTERLLLQLMMDRRRSVEDETRNAASFYRQPAAEQYGLRPISQ